jgi:UDP-glucose 4-epimerase
MKKALITGGMGFIGSHLAEFLLKHNYTVTSIDDLSTGSFKNIEHLLAHPEFNFVIETIMNENVMDRLISERDIIFHLAAAVGVKLIVERPVEVIEKNVLGTEIVLHIANRYRKKIILASSSEIYGKSNDIPFREDSDRILGATTNHRWSYSDSKAIDEFLALAYNKENKLPIVIVRLFNTIGIRQTGRYGMVVPTFIQQAVRGEPITVYGDGTQSRCFCNVRDVVKGITQLAEHPGAIGQIFNLGHDEEISIRQLAEKVKEITRSDSDIVYVPYDLAYEEGFEDMKRRVPDLTKVKRLIGYYPIVTLEESLMEIFQFTKENLSPGGK